MSDPLQLARTARENLAKGLGALQSDPNLPEALLDLAQPIAQAMGALHQIERSQGAALNPHAENALNAVRTALSQLQLQGAGFPAADQAMEAVASSLSYVHSLHKLTQGPAAAPAPAAAAPGVPRPHNTQDMLKTAQIEPRRVSDPSHAAAQAPQPQAPQPGQHGAPYQAYQNGPQQQAPHAPPPQQATQHAPPQQQAPAPQQAPQQQAHYSAPHAPPPAYQPPPQPAQPQFQQPVQQQAQQPVQQPAPQAAPPPHQPAPQAPPHATAPAFQAVADPFARRPSPAPDAAPGAPGGPLRASVPVPSPPAQGDMITVEAALGAHSATNFYKGLSGNDIIDHGGLFVATYMVPKIGSTVRLKVSLPGGYEFEANALVKWARESNDVDAAQPGFGAKLTELSPEARQLVYRYVRNREPLFHDDL